MQKTTILQLMPLLAPSLLYTPPDKSAGITNSINVFRLVIMLDHTQFNILSDQAFVETRSFCLSVFLNS